MEIRSYRRVFDLERRIYRIDQLRLNPAGVPVRGVVYLLALLASVALAARMPLAGAVVGALPWYVKYLVLPAAAATLLGAVRVDGRPFHLAARAALLRALGARAHERLAPCAALPHRWHPQDILFLPDGSDPFVRALRYTGPGAVLIAVEHERRVHTRRRAWLSRANLTIEASTEAPRLERGCVIELTRGATLAALPARGSHRR